MKGMFSGVIVLFTIIISYSQNSSNTQPILLNGLKIGLEEQEWEVIEAEVIDGRIYRIVNGVSSLKLNRTYSGFKVIEFIPKGAFIVSIEKSQLSNVRRFLNQVGVASVLRLRPEWKMSLNILNKNIPNWAWLDNEHFKVSLIYFKDLEGRSVIELLEGMGYEILSHAKDDQFIELSITLSEIEKLASLPFVAYIEEMAKPGVPEGITARTVNRINYIQSNSPGTVKYDGSGVTIGHGDDGDIRPHVDFRGRVSRNSSVGPSTGDHGDHIAGIILGAGNKDPRGMGMAPGAEIFYSDYPDNLGNIDSDFINHGVRITSTSYDGACGGGYLVASNYGARTMDKDVEQNPSVMHVFSAGNSGNVRCGYGVYGTTGGVRYWGNITGGHKVAKNVVTVGQVDQFDGLNYYSSRGPSTDGRIKPDITAMGTFVYSTTDQPEPHSYDTKSGTSMACPSVAGIMATLYQAYKNNNGGFDPESALIKGIVLNTADDLGNPGPDYRFGYGRINARRAHAVLASGNWISGTISSGSNSHNIVVPSGNFSEVRIMLIWADPPAFVSTDPNLINDLDLDVTQGSLAYDPWVLNPFPHADSLNLDAVRARDSLNNIEQVTFPNPGSGNITVSVSEYNIPSGSQNYYIIYEFVKDEIVLTYPIGGEGFSPSRDEYIRWDAPDDSSSFRLEYSLDNGVNWVLLNANVSSTSRYFFWNVPNVISSQARIRLIRGTDTAISPETFVIAEEPTNLSISANCPDSLVLNWDAVSGVSGYNVFAIGSRYMDSIGYTTDTFYTFTPSNPYLNDDWYSVSSVVNGKSGERAIAINKEAGTFNCQTKVDLAAHELLSPIPTLMPDCLQNSNLPIKIQIKNIGNNDIFGYSAGYSFNGGANANFTITDTIQAGQTLDYEFPGSSINIWPGNVYDLKTWVNYTNDDNPYNDTLFEIVRVTTSTSKLIPYFNDFEAFSSCSSASNCGDADCTLNDGWINLANGVLDDIDLRVFSGNTPSNNTGPSMDHNPGIVSGKYAYLEASNGCDSALAILLSPCLIVNSTINIPVVQYAYHMSGTDMGALSVDLLTNSGVVKNVVPKVSGDQGLNWNVGQIDLTPWNGQTVVVRFRAKTGSGFLSDLAVDDFKYFENGLAAPVASYVISDSGRCPGDTFTFASTSIGAISNYVWDFGAGASPSTANTAGPHSVVYSNGGPKLTSLLVSNSSGQSQSQDSMFVNDVPGSLFSYYQNNLSVNFTDASTFNPTAWNWDFGDGAGSTQQNPSHTYSAFGKYSVILKAINQCGSTIFNDTINVSKIGITEDNLKVISLYPNPTSGLIHISYPEDVKYVILKVYDLTGKKTDFPCFKSRFSKKYFKLRESNQWCLHSRNNYQFGTNEL